MRPSTAARVIRSGSKVADGADDFRVSVLLDDCRLGAGR